MLPTIPNQLQSHALRAGGKVAIAEYIGDARREVTFASLYCSAVHLARFLDVQAKTLKHALPERQTSPPYIRIGILAGNVIEAHTFYLACAMSGHVAVPINITFTAREVAEVLASTRAKLVLYEAKYEQVCKNAIALLPAPVDSLQFPTLDLSIVSEWLNDDSVHEPLSALLRPWAILHTSGTTSGKKKGVIRNQFGTIAGILVHQTSLQLTENDKFMAVWPSYGISTFFFASGVLYLGATVVLLDADLAVDPGRSWDVLLEEDVTFTTGSPLHFENWVRVAKRNPSDSLRVALLSGANTSAQNKLALADALGDRCLLCEAYGSTECGVVTLSTDVSKEGVGREPPGVPRVRLAEKTNEILVSRFSPMFMIAYTLPMEESANYFEFNWFKTGDVGRRDSEGNIILLGRVDDRIGLPNGHDLYPAEVEVVLSQLTSDRIIIVTLVDSELVAVLTGPPSDALVAELIRHAEENLAPMKRPTRFLYVDELPMTATNKVKRKEVRQLASSKL